jgi:phosphonate metabolism protein PhnN/1,5-bisphosphokinase (PRPP-forming)
MTRYAIYFAPQPDSPWWDAGCRWLGRDPVNGMESPQTQIPGIPGLVLSQLTANARRYGFHATLKAPFKLADGFTEMHLAGMAQAFAADQRPISLEDMRLRPMTDFLALRPSAPLDEISRLAMRCVSYFDMLRAAPDAAELAKRRRAGLSARQEALLQRWGYPYTEEEFQFHMTLTDSLHDVDADVVYAIRKAAEQRFAGPFAAALLLLDGLTIFREVKPGTPFSVWRRFPFGSLGQERSRPAMGRLFYFVGPSGVGKDALLGWVEQNLPAEANLVFARRTITRPAHASEKHEPISHEAFWQSAAAGQFSMQWQANDQCYGVRRGIEADLKSGRDVIVNGSREYIPQLRSQFPDAQVIWVKANALQIRQRIEMRQRETGAAVQRRVDRGMQFSELEEGMVVDNSGPLDIAGRRLMEILLGQ